jgi:hypothetical protein
MQKEGEVERYKIEKSLKEKTLHWQEDTKIQKRKKGNLCHLHVLHIHINVMT